MTKKRRKRKSKKKDLIKNRIEILCYVCGKSLEEDKVEVEHMWPKSMGGITLSSNLKVCCSECNKNKEQYIDASDFHYEQISLGTRKSDDSFEREFRGVYKVALSAKSDYSCSLCGQPVEVVGRLNFVQRNPNDSWHFLNIDGICNSCISLGDQNGD
ncbi:MAG: HNH endonuclease [Oscillatoriales cyanobacterium SM2_3_0]|nr:HNH endonuclease [Oscillatoriales cyanobacterium SM2_3_0]